MKRIILSVIILAVLAGACCWSVLAIEYKTDVFTQNIREVERAFEEKNSEKCVRAAKKLCSDWDDFLDLSILVNDLGQATDISSSIAEIYSLAKAGDEELYTACNKAKTQIELFRKIQFPTLYNIL